MTCLQRQCKLSTLTLSGTRTHTCIHRCIWSCESHLLNDGLFGVRSGWGAGGVQRGRSGEERQRCGGEDKLDVQKQTVFVPEAQWLSACGTKKKSAELCVYVCVLVSMTDCVCGDGVKSVPVSCSLRSQLWCNGLNELVLNIELNSMNRVTCFSNACVCVRACPQDAWFEWNMKLVTMNRTIYTPSNWINQSVLKAVAWMKCSPHALYSAEADLTKRMPASFTTKYFVVRTYNYVAQKWKTSSKFVLLHSQQHWWERLLF